MFKKITSVKSVLMAGLMAFTFTAAHPEITHAQTVVIPDCPSVDDFPQPGCFDSKDKKENTSKEKEDDKTGEKKEKKPKKS